MTRSLCLAASLVVAALGYACGDKPTTCSEEQWAGMGLAGCNMKLASCTDGHTYELRCDSNACVCTVDGDTQSTFSSVQETCYSGNAAGDRAAFLHEYCSFDLSKS